eukprot:7824461-Heterocapsa_arctica.AAC.1
MRYKLLFYKNNGSFSIRQKLGGNVQVFSFGGKKCKLSKEALQSIAEKVVVKLDRGEMSVEEGKAWCRSQLQ